MHMMKISTQLLLLLPLAMGIGIAMTFQTAINSQLREYLHSPLQAALLSFLVAMLAVILASFIKRRPGVLAVFAMRYSSESSLVCLNDHRRQS
jgi:uncharacterized membrane protein YdcZ (DUF606 family)